MRLAQQVDRRPATAPRPCAAGSTATGPAARPGSAARSARSTRQVGPQVDRQRRRAVRARSRRAAAPTARRPRRPRGRSAVTIASPRTVRPPKREGDALQRLAGEALAKTGLQATSKPQLDGRNGATSTPAPPAVRPGPVRAQPRPAGPAQRQHRGVGRSAVSPSGVAKTQRAVAVPAASSRDRVRSSTPSPPAAPARPAAAARPSAPSGTPGPTSPTKVGWPSPSAQAISAAGGNASSSGRSRGAAAP